MPLIQHVVQIDLPLYLSQLEDHKGSAMGQLSALWHFIMEKSIMTYIRDCAVSDEAGSEDFASFHDR